MHPFNGPDPNQSALNQLEQRIGRVHLNQRLGLEADYEAHVGRGLKRLWYVESWYSAHAIIRNSLRLVGLYGRGRRNARNVRVVQNDIVFAKLPKAFDGYTILHISDPHVDMDPEITSALIERVRQVKYDLCVLTGDYRTRTYGPYEPTLAALARVRPHMKDPIFAVLGNHDTIRMVPGLEAMGIRVLLNECVAIERDGATMYLAGIDDAHSYHLDNIQKAARHVQSHAVSILLSHTPETYQHAAHAGFDLMLCGHTHGGQICLPNGFPIIIDARCPRRFAAGTWRYQNLVGYTSVGSGAVIVDARLNCPPEVTLHRLCCAP